jgi:hypothetical protein
LSHGRSAQPTKNWVHVEFIATGILQVSGLEWHTMKIVINRSICGFDLSDEAWRILFARKFFSWDPSVQTAEAGDFHVTWGADQGRRRTDPDLVAVVEELGDGASGPGAKLRVVEVPDEVDWVIHEIDGKEQVGLREETHRKLQEVSSQSVPAPVLSGSFSG